MELCYLEENNGEAIEKLPRSWMRHHVKLVTKHVAAAEVKMQQPPKETVTQDKTHHSINRKPRVLRGIAVRVVNKSQARARSVSPESVSFSGTPALTMCARADLQQGCACKQLRPC
jgi:hypothetical protein